MGMSSYEQLSDRILAKLDAGKWDEAFEELKMLESDGNAAAIAVLAQFYLHGIGVAKDTELAVELFEKAISLGCGEAAWELGKQYYNDDSELLQNRSKAVSILEKGANLGDASCMGALARCYLFGNGVSENHTKAFDYAIRAAKVGDVNGIYIAAICYDDGLGTNADPGAAYNWYKEYLEYEPDDDEVMLRIALCLADPYERYGIRPTGDMLNEAFFYAGKSVEKGNVEAHLIVGWFYERGEVVPCDYDMAHKYIQIAADNGHEFAREHLNIYRKNLYGNYYIPN